MQLPHARYRHRKAYHASGSCGRQPGGSVTEHLIHRAITAPDSPRDEAHRAPRYPERPWPRTCVWNAAGWRRAAEALLFATSPGSLVSSMSSRRGDRGVPGSGAGRRRQRPKLLRTAAPRATVARSPIGRGRDRVQHGDALVEFVAVTVGQTRRRTRRGCPQPGRWAAESSRSPAAST
jgi:hypothetical protein